MPVVCSHLRLVTAPPPAAVAGACSMPGCRLTACGASGLCGPCARVYAAVFVLLQRLLVRDLARLEAAAPGLTATARTSLDRADQSGTIAGRNGADGSDRARLAWPDRCELAALEDLLGELRAFGAGP